MKHDKKPLTVERANAIFDILIACCGCDDKNRSDFVDAETAMFISEFRFIGSLGFGGKFYRETWGQVPYRVSCYREDITDERVRQMLEANARLAELASRPESDRDEGGEA